MEIMYQINDKSLPFDNKSKFRVWKKKTYDVYNLIKCRIAYLFFVEK